jgi:hypothetical protein
MLTRKQMNLLLQQAIHSQAYDFWVRAKKEGAAWQEERIARLVVTCFKKPTNVWTSGFRDIVDQVGKERTPSDPRLMSTLELLWDSLTGGQVAVHRSRQAVRIMMDLPPAQHADMCKLAKLANLNIVQVADKCSDFALTQLSSASYDLKQVCRGSRRSSNQVSVTRP